MFFNRKCFLCKIYTMSWPAKEYGLNKGVELNKNVSIAYCLAIGSNRELDFFWTKAGGGRLPFVSFFLLRKGKSAWGIPKARSGF